MEGDAKGSLVASYAAFVDERSMNDDRTLLLLIPP